MFKMVKKLLIALGIIFFLFCTMVLLIRVDVISLPTDTGIKLFNIDADKLEQIDISNKSDDYTLIINGIEDVILKGYEDKLHDIDITRGVVETCRKVYAYDTIEKDATDLSIYGLDNPQMTVTVRGGDDMHTLYVGNMMPNNNSYYVLLDNEATVYAVNDEYIYYYKQEPFKYLSKNVGLLTEADTEYMIDNFSLTKNGEPIFEFRSFTDEEKTFYNISNLYKITYPYSAVAKDANIVNYLNSIVTLDCAKIITLDVNETSLKEAGLDNPMYEITYDYFDEDYKLRISEPDAGISNLYIEGSDVIYSFLAQKIQLLDFDIFNLVNSVQFNRDISLVERVIVNIEGTDYVYGISQANGTISEVTYNNQKIDSEQYKNFYTLLINSRVDGVALNEAKEDAELSFTFKYNSASGYKNDIVSFHEIDSRQYLMKINDEGSFFVSSVYLDKIIESVNALNAGQNVNPEW